MFRLKIYSIRIENEIKVNYNVSSILTKEDLTILRKKKIEYVAKKKKKKEEEEEEEDSESDV